MWQPKRKYKNTVIEHEGIKFDSKKEMKRFIVLKEAEKKGVISDLKLQVKFELIPPIFEDYTVQLKTKEKTKTRLIQRAITYTCDFQYIKNGELVVEDVKASPHMLPKEFSLKAKLFFWKYRKNIRLVYSSFEEV